MRSSSEEQHSSLPTSPHHQLEFDFPLRFEHARTRDQIKSYLISSGCRLHSANRTERKNCAALILRHPAPPRRLRFKNRKESKYSTSMRRGKISPQACSREKLSYKRKLENETGEASVTSCPTSLPSLPSRPSISVSSISQSANSQRWKGREGFRYGTALTTLFPDPSRHRHT